MKKEPLLLHLQALRVCLTRAVIAVIITVSGAAFFAKPLFNWFSAPLDRALPAGSHFIATSPMEAWVVYFKVALLAGIFAAAPVIFWQLWRFISPALHEHERRLGVVFVAVASLFFIGGAVFAFYIVFPLCFSYFTSVLAGTSIALMPRMDSYFDFAAQLIISFGFIFELPLLIFFLAAWEFVSFARFKEFRKYFVVIAFAIAAILTPQPDILSQLSMSIPLLFLYEVGVWSAWFYRKLWPRKSE